MLGGDGCGSICDATGFANGKTIEYPQSEGDAASAYSFDQYILASSDSPLAHIDGWPINVANQASGTETIIDAARRAEGFCVFTLNLDRLVKLRCSAAFRRAYRHARFTTADSASVAMIAARQDPRIERITSADLVVALLERAGEERLPVYLFGARPGTIARAASDLVERSEGSLNIAGSASPPNDFDPEGPDADAALDKIAASGARLCLVALGAPKQELFAARAAERGIKVGFVCIGSALDAFAGQQVRAPELMQHNSLEWLCQLAKRYLHCTLLFVDLVVVAPIRSFLMDAAPHR